jgi:hypothetical protein
MGEGLGHNMRDNTKRLKQVFNLVRSIPAAVNAIRGRTVVPDLWFPMEPLGNTPQTGPEGTLTRQTKGPAAGPFPFILQRVERIYIRAYKGAAEPS